MSHGTAPHREHLRGRRRDAGCTREDGVVDGGVYPGGYHGGIMGSLPPSSLLVLPCFMLDFSSSPLCLPSDVINFMTLISHPERSTLRRVVRILPTLGSWPPVSHIIGKPGITGFERFSRN